MSNQKTRLNSTRQHDTQTKTELHTGPSSHIAHAESVPSGYSLPLHSNQSGTVATSSFSAFPKAGFNSHVTLLNRRQRALSRQKLTIELYVYTDLYELFHVFTNYQSRHYSNLHIGKHQAGERNGLIFAPFDHRLRLKSVSKLTMSKKHTFST